MLRREVNVAALLLLLAAVCARGQGPDGRAPDPSQLFREARAVGPAEQPHAFEFELSGYTYRLASNGAGRRVRGDQTRLFNLRLVELDEIRRVRFMEYEGNVLLLCTLDYGEGHADTLYRLEQPSMRALWSRDVPAPHARAVREGGALYLAGYSFAARLDLRTGAYAWQHGRHLERRKNPLPLSDFEQPDISGDAALFRPTPARPGDASRTFRIHKKSGRILGVE